MFKEFKLVLAALLIVGCGYNPEKPVYDTKGNPHGFPQTACALLNRIEIGQLSVFDSITNAFGELYTENSALLDNDEWHKVIDRLGAKFQYLGDQAMEKGVTQYSRAAGYYSLASFARPDDLQARRQSELFSAWKRGIADSTIDTASFFAAKQASLIERIDLLKPLVFGDSLQRDFALSYLVSQLLNPLADSKTLSGTFNTSLSTVDSAFLAYLELVEVPADDPVVQFVDPSIDLVAYQLSQLNDNLFRAELYFVPRETISEDYAVAFWVDSRQPEHSERITGSGYFTFDFSPNQPTSRWPVNKVAAAYSEFTYTGPLTALAIGLYVPGKRGIDYLPVAGNDSAVVRLPILLHKAY